MGTWDGETRAVLEGAGWFPGRCASALVEVLERRFDEVGMPMTAAARNILLEFGGLEVKQQGPGEQCARESFVVDPSTMLGENAVVASWSEQVGRGLFPIGELGQGSLLVDEDGRVYLALDDVLGLVGTDVYEALDALTRGLRLRPLAGV